jgi:hypothetical protein
MRFALSSLDLAELLAGFAVGRFEAGDGSDLIFVVRVCFIWVTSGPALLEFSRSPPRA